MSLSIIKHHDDAVAPLVRDVTHVHPDWVHEQLGTQSEAELQHFLDACDEAEFAKNSGQPDDAGVFMPDEGQTEPSMFRLPWKHKPEVTATIHITGIGPVAIETDLDEVVLVGALTSLGWPVNCKTKKVSRNKRTAKRAADTDAAWLTEIMPGHFMLFESSYCNDDYDYT